MIKIDIITEKHGDKLKIKNRGQIAGEREIVVQEMTEVLNEFHALDDGALLVRAFDEFMGGIFNDESEG